MALLHALCNGVFAGEGKERFVVPGGELDRILKEAV